LGKIQHQTSEQHSLLLLLGVASANYLTPSVVDILKISGEDYVFSIAFLIGFMGLKIVEAVSEKLFKKMK
jgi:hypothetical protein